MTESEKPVDKKVIKKPVDKKVIKKPVDKKVIKKPVDKKVIKKPVDKKVIKKPVDKKSFKDGGSINQPGMREMNPYDLTESYIGRLIKIPERNIEGILLSFNKEHIKTKNSWEYNITKYYTILYLKLKNDTTSSIKLQSYNQDDTMFIETSPTDNILKKTISSDSSAFIKKQIDNKVIKNLVDKKSSNRIEPYDLFAMHKIDISELDRVRDIGAKIKIPGRGEAGIIKDLFVLPTKNGYCAKIKFEPGKYYSREFIKLDSYKDNDTIYIERIKREKNIQKAQNDAERPLSTSEQILMQGQKRVVIN